MTTGCTSMEVIGNLDKNSFSEVAVRENRRKEIGNNKYKRFFQEVLLLRKRKK